ncbi:hypothetical protein J6590_099431 [Homalodisca vitripennis]|nr:hypothetical protein J6590_099431 [Homalodisca vitripennis]
MEFATGASTFSSFFVPWILFRVTIIWHIQAWTCRHLLQCPSHALFMHCFVSTTFLHTLDTWSDNFDSLSKCGKMGDFLALRHLLTHSASPRHHLLSNHQTSSVKFPLIPSSKLPRSSSPPHTLGLTSPTLAKQSPQV